MEEADLTAKPTDPRTPRDGDKRIRGATGDPGRPFSLSGGEDHSHPSERVLYRTAAHVITPPSGLIRC